MSKLVKKIPISKKALIRIAVVLALMALVTTVGAPTAFAQQDSGFLSGLGNVLKTAASVFAGGPGGVALSVAPAIFNSVLAGIAFMLLSLAAMVVGLAGLLLDGAMYLTVNMRVIVDAVPMVDVGWKIFRDLANLAFIFILLYSAIAIILNAGNARRLIVDVIITALLINFSLLITKVVVDVSNIVALQFYDAVRVTGVANSEGAPALVATSVSSALMQGLNLPTLYSNQQATARNAAEQFLGDMSQILTDGTKMMIIGVGGSALMLVAAFSFAIAALLLLIRIVVLMFLMVIAPLAFVARILPQTKSAWNKWWSTLLNNAIFAPAYFAATYLIIQTVAQGGLRNLPQMGMQNATFVQMLAGQAVSTVGLLINFVFVIILMIASIFISKSLGVYGTSTVMGWAKAAGGAARRAGGWAVRKTAGEYARRWEEEAKLRPERQTWLAQRFRNIVTKPLKETRFAGAKSAQEAYEERKEEKESLKDAQTANTVINLGQKLQGLKASRADKEQIRPIEEELQNKMLELSPKTFASIAMRHFQTIPELARYADSSKFQTLMGYDKKTDEEKRAITLLRNKHITDVFEATDVANAKALVMLKEHPELYEAFQAEGLKILLKDDADLKTPEEKALKAGLTKAGIKWTQKDQEEYQAAYDEVRGRSVKELGYLNRASAEAINKIAPVLNWWQVKGMRSSDDFTYSQREGVGGSLREYKETSALNAMDLIMGVDLTDAKGNPRSIEERAADRYKISNVWQKVQRYGAAALSDVKLFTDKERDIYQKMVNYQQTHEKQLELGIQMLTEHHAGRSPDELTNPPGRVRNIPVNIMTYGANVLRPMMGKDNVHHEKLTMNLLRAYNDGKLTEAAKSFLGKMLFDRDGKDFFPEWRKLAKEMGLDPDTNARMKDLSDWANEGPRGQEKFNQLKTVELIDTLPGRAPGSAGSSGTGGASGAPSGGAPAGSAGPAGGAGSGGGTSPGGTP